MTAKALRTALIWHDEVMGDVVMPTPRTITLGSSGKETFTVPNLGLPDNFAVVRAGNRGFLLTLGDKMRGTICIDGQEKDVAEFVRRGGEGDGLGGFRATPISDGDWGVIELDGSGTTKLFFNFVPYDEAPVFFTKPVLIAGGAGYLLSAIALLVVFMLTGHADMGIDEAAFRGFGLSTLALIVAACGWSLIRQEGDSQASFAFSVVLHAAILLMTYQLYVPDNPFVWPGPKSLTGNYLVTRLDPDPPPEPEKPKPTVGVKQDTAAPGPKTPEKKTAHTKGDEGKAGGKGDVERAKDPNANDKETPDPPKVAFFEDRNRKFLDNIVDRNLSTSLSKFNGIKDDIAKTGAIGFGKGTGSGVGDGLMGTGTKSDSKGKGSGGGGKAKGEFVSSGKLDTGGERAGGGGCVGAGCAGTGMRQVAVAFEQPSGDFSGLSREEIDRVVRARQGVFRACYQKELNRSPGIGGKLVINFVIDAGGTVKSSRRNGGNLKSDAVEQCVKSNIMRLKFPAKGGAIVNYPFVFSQGA